MQYSTTLAAPTLNAATDEKANQITHAFGFALSVVGSLVMMPVAFGEALRFVACGLYCVTLMAVDAASTLSHSFGEGRLRDRYRTLDQVCIFFLIVGTFTPVALEHLRGVMCWGLLGLMWLIAVVGSVRRFTRGDRSMWTYLMLGWMPIVAVAPIAASAGTNGAMIVVGGGLLYSTGAVFLAKDGRRPYFHAIWHMFVIAGSACHYLFVYQFVAMRTT
ncbi:MAG: hemolysin III family protein [Planctomycetaceae bacterium]